jgi:hypothetical protein
VNLLSLREAARKATPGPWKAGGKSVSAEETEDRLGMDCRLFGGNADDNRRNARHIANMDPATVLALVAVVEAARKLSHMNENANVNDQTADEFAQWFTEWDAAWKALRETVKPFEE